MKTVGIVLGSGVGQRFKSTIPKQFMMLDNKMVIQYPIDTLRLAEVDYIICTLPPNYSKIKELQGITELIHGVDKFVVGGDWRSQSVINALEACPPDTTHVIFIDAVRPFVKPSDIKKGLLELQGDPEIKYVLTGQLITDSLFSVHSHLDGKKVVRGEDRDKFRLSVSPEIIDYKALYSIYQNKEFIRIVNPEFTAKVFNFYPDVKGKFVDYFGTNLKITYEDDLCIAEQLVKQVKSKEVKEANVAGRKIILVGENGSRSIKNYLEELGATVTVATEEVAATEPGTGGEQFSSVIYCAGWNDVNTEDPEQYHQFLLKNIKKMIDVICISQRKWLHKGGNIVILSPTVVSQVLGRIPPPAAPDEIINTLVEFYHPLLLKQNIRINVISVAKLQTKLPQEIDPMANRKEIISTQRLAEIASLYVDTSETGKVIYVNSMEGSRFQERPEQESNVLLKG